MCGRYTAAKDFSELIKLVGVVMARVPFFAPRYNISPTQMAAVIYRERREPAVKLMRWGLIPSWAKDESVGNALINARSETLESRNAFREAFQKRRCLILADSFFEWQERTGKRQPFRVMLKSGEPFFFAGLWDRWVKPPATGKYGKTTQQVKRVKNGLKWVKHPYRRRHGKRVAARLQRRCQNPTSPVAPGATFRIRLV
jgi:putative SOS response-associated peptidase YedK